MGNNFRGWKLHQPVPRTHFNIEKLMGSPQFVRYLHHTWYPWGLVMRIVQRSFIPSAQMHELLVPCHICFISVWIDIFFPESFEDWRESLDNQTLWLIFPINRGVHMTRWRGKNGPNKWARHRLLTLQHGREAPTFWQRLICTGKRADGGGRGKLEVALCSWS